MVPLQGRRQCAERRLGLDGLGGRVRELADEVVPDKGRARVTDRERLGRHELGQVGAVRVRDELEVERRLAAAVGRSVGRVERVVLLERGGGVGETFRRCAKEMRFISPSFNSQGWTEVCCQPKVKI